MMLPRIIDVILVLTVMSATVKGYTPYGTFPEDDALLQHFLTNPNCKKIDLGDGVHYQKIRIYNLPGTQGNRLLAFGVEACPELYEFKDCECRLVASEAARLLTSVPGTGNEQTNKCAAIADIKFSNGGYNNGGGFVRVINNVARANLPSMQQTVGANTYLKLNGLPLVLQRFAGNDLRGSWMASLRFRPDDNGRNGQVLLSDDCDDAEDVSNRQEKSIEVTIDGNTLNVFLRFSNDSLSTADIKCPLKYDVDGLATLTMESVNDTIAIKVGNNVCPNSLPKAHLAVTNCALYLGANPKDPKTSFYGFIHHFTFKKTSGDCEM